MSDPLEHFPSHDDAHLHAAASISAIQHILCEAGLTTPKKFEQLRLQCQAKLEQMVEERQQKYWEAHPQEKKGYDCLKDLLGQDLGGGL
jgi:hypothetical protein